MDPELQRLVQASDLAARVLRRRPGLAAWLKGSRALDRPKSAERYGLEAMAAVRGADAPTPALLKARLRRYKYRELLRLMFRDIVLSAPQGELGQETSALAQALIRAALSRVEQSLEARYGAPDPKGFCVLGLGKLGGEDLNFSSDVDLVYLYRGEGETRGVTGAPPIPSAAYFTRLAEALTLALSDVTEDGFCYRVDLNLRPQGRGGALALSLPAARAYYEAFGRTWERAALLKARVVAGDASLGREFLESVEPFVWRRIADLGVVDSLRDLKAQIDLRARASADDVKLGPGGIREVEFFVNALQLLHGGRSPALRERNTMRALRRLEQAGLVSATDTDALEEAYLLLRRVENHLQMVDERQTHTLPTGAAELARLAASLGFAGPEVLTAELGKARGFVQGAFRTLLGQTATGGLPDDPLLALALDPDAPRAEREAALVKEGFFLPDRAVDALERLARAFGSPFRQGAPGSLALRLLSEAARSPDPDQALFHLSELFSGLTSPSGYFHLLGELPHVSRRLMNLFGQSEYLSRYFERNPELLDTFVRPEDERTKPPARTREELLARVSRSDAVEDRLSAMRRFRNEEVLRVGLADISGELSVPEVADQLTALAEVVLEQALFLAEAELQERYGEVRQEGRRQALAVLGLGKLGGRELGYHSDLDLLFVYAGRGDAETSGGSRGRLASHEYFAKVAQRLLTFLQMQLREGHLYKIDTRLRPSGNQGPLVISLDAFVAHHARRAQLWERQALVKARPVAGDASLGQEIAEGVLGTLVYERPLPSGAAAEIHRLRMRMEHEVAGESREQLNSKTGEGGLVDVEFAVQYLQLLHGGRDPAVRNTNTLLGLSALESAGALPQGEARVLREGYLFSRRLENRLRLIHGYSLSHLPTGGRALALLARRLGYLGPGPGEAFLEEYRRVRARVRAAYARVMGV